MLTADHPDDFPSSGAGRGIAEALVALLDGAADPKESAAALVRSWTMIENALTPILGRRGVAALYRRSLDVTGSEHQWLLDLRPGSTGGVDLAALQTAVVEQGAPEGTTAARAILRAFGTLMVSLVGLSLTERLLGPVLVGTETRSLLETLR